MTRWEKERFGLMQKGNNLKFFGVEPNGWINSNDQLPDGDKDILIWSGEKVIVGGYNTIDKVFWCEVAGYIGTWGLDKITYWMPAPEQPEAE